MPVRDARAGLARERDALLVGKEAAESPKSGPRGEGAAGGGHRTGRRLVSR